MLLYIIQRGGRDASTSVTSLTLHIPSSRLIYVTPMSPYRPCCRYKSCLYTNSTYTTSHSLVHLKHNLTQPRTILGIQLHSSLYQFATIIFQNNKRGAPRGAKRCKEVRGGAPGGARRCAISCTTPRALSVLRQYHYVALELNMDFILSNKADCLAKLASD